MQRLIFNQDRLISNYNHLVDDFKKINVNLKKLNVEGVCAGLTLNFLMFAKEKRLDEFYRYLELTFSLTEKTRNDIIDQSLFDPNNKLEGAISFKASFDKKEVLISKKRFLHFLKVISDAQSKQKLHTIGCQWDSTDLVFCNIKDLTERLREILDHNGSYFIENGFHAFGVEKREDGFLLFEPNNINQEIFKNVESLASAIIHNHSRYRWLIKHSIGFNVYVLSYGNENRELDDLIKEFEDIINKEKNQNFIDKEMIFANAKKLISSYRRLGLSRKELRSAFSDELAQVLEFLKMLPTNEDRQEEEKTRVVLLFNDLQFFKAKFDLHLEKENHSNKIKADKERIKAFKDTKLYNDFSPLVFAAMSNQVSLLKYLLEIGADPNLTAYEKNSALNVAATDGHLECLNVLLVHPKIDVNLVNKKGDSALHSAAGSGKSLDCLHALLATNIDPNLANDSGITPLHYAAGQGNLDCLNVLLALPNIDPNRTDNDGETAIYNATQFGKLDCLYALLAHPSINPNIASNEGKTPLFIACELGKLACVQALIPHMDDLNRTLPNGATPLYIAAQNGHSGCVKALLEGGANLNVSIERSVDALLQEAEKKGRKSNIEALLNINKPSSMFSSIWAESVSVPKMTMLNGFNPLHAAAFFGRAEVVEILLENAVDIEKKTGDITAIDLAKAMGHKKIVMMLENAGIENNKINFITQFVIKNIDFFTWPFVEERKNQLINVQKLTRTGSLLINYSAQIKHALDESGTKTLSEKMNEYKNIVLKLKNNPSDTKALFKFLKKNKALIPTMLSFIGPANDDKNLSKQKWSK